MVTDDNDNIRRSNKNIFLMVSLIIKKLILTILHDDSCITSTIKIFLHSNVKDLISTRIITPLWSWICRIELCAIDHVHKQIHEPVYYPVNMDIVKRNQDMWNHMVLLVSLYTPVPSITNPLPCGGGRTFQVSYISTRILPRVECQWCQIVCY